MRKPVVKKSGVYKIVNTINKNTYVGSSIDLVERWYRHKKDLRRGKHHSHIFQKDYDIYGMDAFIFIILESEEPDKEKLTGLEQKYIDELLPVYNICRFANSIKGRKDSEATREKKRKIAIDTGCKPPAWTWQEKRKKVAMVKDGEVVKEFESTADAIRYIGKDVTFSSSISRAIKRNIKCYGYHWKHL